VIEAEGLLREEENPEEYKTENEEKEEDEEGKLKLSLFSYSSRLLI
jgi:hypothetical protein